MSLVISSTTSSMDGGLGSRSKFMMERRMDSWIWWFLSLFEEVVFCENFMQEKRSIGGVRISVLEVTKVCRKSAEFKMKMSSKSDF